jgi:predicted lipoprotein with Yx(FWY)xxD motif
MRNHFAYLIGPAFIFAVMTSALAQSSIESAPIPAEISLMKNGGQYTFQNDLGNSFYTFDEDGPNKSNCIESCAKSWPPVAASKTSKAMGDWTLVARPTGAKQWAYRGHPVYTSAAENAGGSPPDLEKDAHWHKLVP